MYLWSISNNEFQRIFRSSESLSSLWNPPFTLTCNASFSLGHFLIFFYLFPYICNNWFHVFIEIFFSQAWLLSSTVMVASSSSVSSSWHACISSSSSSSSSFHSPLLYSYSFCIKCHKLLDAARVNNTLGMWPLIYVRTFSWQRHHQLWWQKCNLTFWCRSFAGDDSPLSRAQLLLQMIPWMICSK